MTETLGAEGVHELSDAFLRGARDVIVNYDGYASQFVGDEVMVFSTRSYAVRISPN